VEEYAEERGGYLGGQHGGGVKLAGRPPILETIGAAVVGVLRKTGHNGTMADADEGL
jgi:hypothetical protein